ncbi:MAG TPA: winged helix-turn-helix domain-containing protein [Streptosporangiaceae bacterium]|nr:winged helix-turn-helix domain-containing protein [Streptosporangiaceae bacterium]
MDIVIDRLSPVPAKRQLANALRKMIADGELPVDEETQKMRLPSIHALITETGLALNTVRGAFDLLRQDGLIVTVPGRGTFVL